VCNRPSFRHSYDARMIIAEENKRCGASMNAYLYKICDIKADDLGFVTIFVKETYRQTFIAPQTIVERRYLHQLRRVSFSIVFLSGLPLTTFSSTL